MFKNSSKKFSKLKVKFNSHCEDERSEDAAIQTKSTGLPRAKASRLTKVGFTLAEVLITLVIIGVVAAITVPMLMNDTNDKQWNVARQKALATIGEAFRLATVNGEISTSYANAKDFVSEVLAKKYLKISKQCDSATDCGFSSVIKRPDGTTLTLPTKLSESTYPVIVDESPTQDGQYGTFQNFEDVHPAYNNSTFFQTLDGFSVNFFYNPYCISTQKEKYRSYDLTLSENAYSQQAMDMACFNAVYDMNGAKAPNTVGKDIGFVTAFYNSYDTKAVAVLPHKDEVLVQDLPHTDNEYWKAAFDYCANLSEDNYILPDIYEMASIYLNGILLYSSVPEGRWFYTRTPFADLNSYFWAFSFYSRGSKTWDVRNHARSDHYARCIRRTTLK